MEISAIAESADGSLQIIFEPITLSAYISGEFYQRKSAGKNGLQQIALIIADVIA